ncbi:MAG TPA: hypothetical protein VLA92_01545 [Candidatus Saccharimonadales bacterium]|nr:hypothetical protein [Candidatus Saccharimonadales bacterium]
MTQNPYERLPFEENDATADLDKLAAVANTAGSTTIGTEVSLGLTGPERESRTLTLDLEGVSDSQVDTLLAERVPAVSIRPELVLPEDVTAPEVYARLGDQERKGEYRSALRDGLFTAWTEQYGEERATKVLGQFNQLTSVIDEEGALVLGDLIDRGRFGKLVRNYDDVMRRDGSTSLLHSYTNLQNQPDFLGNQDFNGAFFHPLAVALVSNKVGGAVRVVDARAKDAGPITAQAQDNMPHIDNTPFRDEVKVLVTWEQGKASGPKGQNFTYLPGTHKGVRDCLIGSDGPYSTENASIFIRPEDIDQAFDLQRQVRPGGNTVVEIQDKDRPTTTVFPSGSLVHHRLRTEAGHSRSGLIIAFHRAGDTPGELIRDYEPEGEQPLESRLFGYQDAESDDDFCQTLVGSATEIAEKVEEIFADNTGTTIINAEAKTLSDDEMRTWYDIATEAPTVEQIKQREGYFPLGGELDSDEFMDLLGKKMMRHDKHGPIDMILYADGHEEPRKWARNRIREMREEDLVRRLDEWRDQIRQPEVADLLTIDDMDEITAQLVANAAAVSPEQRAYGQLDPIERISPQGAYRSVEQLIYDLGENLTRANDRQTYLSASLFQFWHVMS